VTLSRLATLRPNEGDGWVNWSGQLFWLTCRRSTLSPRLDWYGSPPEAGGPVSSVFRDRTRTRL